MNREYVVITFIAVAIAFVLGTMSGCDRRPRECPDCPEPLECPEPTKPCDLPPDPLEAQWALECIVAIGQDQSIDDCVESAAMVYRGCRFDL